MTKVELHYEFTRPFENAWLDAIERLHSVYGFHSIRLSPPMTSLEVVYDASRLTAAGVEHHLHAAGLPVRRVVVHA